MKNRMYVVMKKAHFCRSHVLQMFNGWRGKDASLQQDFSLFLKVGNLMQ